MEPSSHMRHRPPSLGPFCRRVKKTTSQPTGPKKTVSAQPRQHGAFFSLPRNLASERPKKFAQNYPDQDTGPLPPLLGASDPPRPHTPDRPTEEAHSLGRISRTVGSCALLPRVAPSRPLLPHNPTHTHIFSARAPATKLPRCTRPLNRRAWARQSDHPPERGQLPARQARHRLATRMGLGRGHSFFFDLFSSQSHISGLGPRLRFTFASLSGHVAGLGEDFFFLIFDRFHFLMMGTLTWLPSPLGFGLSGRA